MLCFSTASLLPAFLWADCLVDLLLWLSAWRNVIMHPSFGLALRLAASVSGFPTRVWLWLPPPQRPAGPENATHCALPREICFSSVTLAARSTTAASLMWPNVKGLGERRVSVRWGLWWNVWGYNVQVLRPDTLNEIYVKRICWRALLNPAS